MKWVGLLVLSIATVVLTTLIVRSPASGSPLRRWLEDHPVRQLGFLATLIAAGLILVFVDFGTTPRSPRVPAAQPNQHQSGCAEVRSDAPTLPSAGSNIGVYLTDDTDPAHAIYGVDLATGRVRWELGVGATPTTYVWGHGVLYVAAGARLLAVEMRRGTVLWRDRAGAPLLADDGTVYAASMTTLSAVNDTDGAVEWSQQTVPAGPPIPVTVADGTFVEQEGAAVVGRAISDGHSVWTYTLPRGGTGQAQIPQLIGYVGTRLFLQGTSEVYAFDPVFDEQCWTRRVGRAATVTVRTQQLLIESHNRVSGMNPSTGNVMWTVHAPTGQDVIGTRGPSVYFAGDGFSAIDTQTGKALWSAPADPALPPLVTAREVFVAQDSSAGDGLSLVALRTSNGEVLWQAPIGLNPNGPSTALGIFLYHATVICTDQLNATRAYSVRTGRTIWTFDPGYEGAFAVMPFDTSIEVG